MRGLGGRGLTIVTMRVVGFRRRGVIVVMRRSGVVIMTVVAVTVINMGRGRGRMVIMCGLGVGRLGVRGLGVGGLGVRGRRVIVVTLIVMPVRGRSLVVVTMAMVVVRLVLVAHDSIPQPLCAVFSGESGIT